MARFSAHQTRGAKVWHTLVLASVMNSAAAAAISSSTSAPSPPVVPRKTFLGGGVRNDGTSVSLIFSDTATASGWSMVNTLYPEGNEPQSRHIGLSDDLDLVLNGSALRQDGGHTTWDVLSSGVVTVSVDRQHNQQFVFPNGTLFYGVWEYPWGGAITNNHYGSNISATSAAARTGQSTLDIGIYGTQPGINWCNARAPFFFTDSGIGVYVDTKSPVAFTFEDRDDGSGESSVTLATNESTLSYHILYDHANPKSLLKAFAKLSSYPMMPTEAGYGPIFWSDNFEQGFLNSSIVNAQENIIDVANHLDAYKIRATAFFADRPYGTGNQSYGNFDFDPAFYPDPVGFISSLAMRGYDFQVWTANRAFLFTELFNVSSSHGWLFPGVDPTKFLGPALNLSIPEAYNYSRDRLTEFVSKMGIAGFKIDRGEEHEMPDDEQNIQQPLYLKLCEEVMQAARGVAGAYYNFARSAFDRDRSHIAIWNGDSFATFLGLQYTVASGIRAGLLGFSHWGGDTGGYVRANGGPTEELFARWMHYSAWTPMYEIMVGLNHTPWYEYSPRLTEVLRQTAETHTRLVPYLRSLAYEASLTGIPAIRAMFLEFPDDRSVHDTTDMYTLGSEFLVAPILEEGGGRSVRFPTVLDNRAKFLDYNDKSTVFKSGDVDKITDLPLESSPVYVREGAIIPLGDVYAGNIIGWNTSSWSPYLTIEVYPSYDVPVISFVYYRGTEARHLSPGPVTITMRTNITTRTVEIEADGDYGVDAEVVVYQKTNGTSQRCSVMTLGRDTSIASNKFVAHGVYSLFE